MQRQDPRKHSRGAAEAQEDRRIQVVHTAFYAVIVSCVETLILQPHCKVGGLPMQLATCWQLN